MNVLDFRTYLVAASYRAVRFASEFVKDKLEYDFEYYVIAMYDKPPVEKDPDRQYVYFPEEKPKVFFYLSEDDVVKLLCREERFVPSWIDISAHSVRKGKTMLRLICNGVYSARMEDLVYNSWGTGPFGTKSPSFPIKYVKGKKFRLSDCPSDAKWIQELTS